MAGSKISNKTSAVILLLSYQSQAGLWKCISVSLQKKKKKYICILYICNANIISMVPTIGVFMQIIIEDPSLFSEIGSETVWRLFSCQITSGWAEKRILMKWNYSILMKMHKPLRRIGCIKIQIFFLHGDVHYNKILRASLHRIG